MPDRTMSRGDSFVFDVQVLRPPPGAPNAPPIPVNITGWRMWFTAKYQVNDPDNTAVAQVTSDPTSVPAGGGIVFTQPLQGSAEITMPPLATYTFPDGPVVLVYDVQVKTNDSTPRIFTVESGTLTVNPDVTRAIS
jgi:hypothetical protein